MRKSTRNKLLITGVVGILGITFLVYSVLANSVNDRWVSEVRADPHAWLDKKVRVLGYVQPGTKQAEDDQHAVASFVIEKDGRRMRVEFKGRLPDTLVDQSEASALGHLEQRGDDYVLAAEDVSAKCPSKYEGARTNLDLAQKPKYQ